MKRLDNYLLTHYPLLWNLRLHWVWPVILLLHLLFWVAGYGSVSLPRSLSYYSLEPQGGVISLAVLSALVLLVLWLVFYLRNNAFKSFYPLRKGRLVAEFGLLLVTAAGLTTFTASYAGGVYNHVRGLTSDVDLTAEVNTVNLAHHFLPFDRQSFSVYEDCFFHPSRSTPRDSVLPGSDYSDMQRTTSSTATDTFSFLHYCSDAYVFRNVQAARTPAENDAIAKRWLYGGRRDSVTTIIEAYLKLCKKYSVDYKFEAAAGAAEVFATPGFLVREELAGNSYASENRESNHSGFPMHEGTYIDQSKVNYALSAIESARTGWLSWEGVLFFWFFSLAITLLIFSFRITAIRVWFIALIGTGIWMAIFGALASFTGGSDIVLSIVFLLLSVAFLFAGMYYIRRREKKRTSGVLLLWALWSLPVLLPLISNLAQRLSAPHYYDGQAIEIGVKPSLYDWVNQHWPMIQGANVLLVLAMICLVFIPLARRWQAGPEE